MKVWAPKKIPERSKCFLNSSLLSFAIRLTRKSTFLKFVIQCNETGHGVEDRVVDRSGQLDGSEEAFRKNTNAIWHLSQTLSVTAAPWQITHKRDNTAPTSALMPFNLSAVVDLCLSACFIDLWSPCDLLTTYAVCTFVDPGLCS